MIAAAKNGPAPKVKSHLSPKYSQSKTSLVFGTLPGATDETIYVTAHRDGWFEAASDNGGGVAGMLGLAEYYAKIPKTQRRRTMTFIAWTDITMARPAAWAGAGWWKTKPNSSRKPR